MKKWKKIVYIFIYTALNIVIIVTLLNNIIITNSAIRNRIYEINENINHDIQEYIACTNKTNILLCGRNKTKYANPIIKSRKHNTFLSQSLFNIKIKYSLYYRCSNVMILIGILTRPECLYERTVMRRIINQIPDVKYTFISGISNNESINSLLYQELHVYNDILIIYIISSYYNCSLIMISFYQFINNNCNNIEWIMKLDIDTYFNIKRIISLINNAPNNVSVIGSIHRKPQLICDRKYKWSISCDTKNKSSMLYPSYPYGPGFLFKFSSIKCINEYITLHDEIIWIEDVLFGVIMKYCNLIYQDVSHLTAITYQAKNNLFILSDKVFVHGLRPIEILLKHKIDIGIITA